jgi:hypothetical protein
MAITQTQTPNEDYGNGTLEKQLEICRASLNYGGRFQTPQPSPGATNNDARWDAVEKASGVRK